MSTTDSTSTGSTFTGPTSAEPAAVEPTAPVEHTAPYGAVPPQRRTTIRTLQAFKDRHERFAMLTSYDRLTAGVFDGAGVPVLLVGDSAGNNALGHDDTVPVTVEELLPLVRAVVRGTRRALVVADLPFGSYEISPAQALATGFRMLKEGGAQAVKLEGGVRVAAQIEALTTAGIPVMAHLGFTPQSVHALGGYRVQGRGEAAEALERDALAVVAAGAFAVVLEMVPAEVAARITELIPVPTIGIGAGVGCDGQVLVWTDMAGLTEPPTPRFVRRYADLRTVLGDAASAFVKDVAAGAYPDEAHSFS